MASRGGGGCFWAACVWICRLGLLGVGVVHALWPQYFDAAVARVWERIRDNPVYGYSGFETLQASLVYPVCYWGFVGLSNIVPASWRHKGGYGGREHGVWYGGSVRGLFLQFLTYALPLTLLDLTTRKRYPGWTDEQAKLPYWGLHTSRNLPQVPPSFLELLRGCVGALVLYDFLFYFIHRFLFHGVAFVYKNVHREHHEHASVFPGVTNQLTHVERVGLVLLANECLKLVQAHPLSRSLFVFCFLFLLTDSHSGLHLPLNWNQVLLCGRGGSTPHLHHHVHRNHNFAPFFPWCDAIFGTQAQDAQGTDSHKQV